jgi:hypothetical protein
MMRWKVGILAIGVISLAVASIAEVDGETSEQTRVAAYLAKNLRPVSTFARIADDQARSIALFTEAGKVLQHPRCVNCHPATERPTQTDWMRPHQPLVIRGADGHGAAGMRCTTCHHADNFDPGHIPGHPDWHLAPATMAWQGRSLAQICSQIKDRSRNGGRDLVALIHHVSEDSLVGWAWAPGAGRTPAPGSQAEFGELMKAWAVSGAFCPKS